MDVGQAAPVPPEGVTALDALTLIAPELCAPAAVRAAAERWPDRRLRVASEPSHDGWSDGDVVWWDAADPLTTPPPGRLPLEGLAEEAGFDLAPFGSLLELERVGASIYALPTGYTAQLLGCNADLVAGAGLAPPGPDLTWDGLVALVAALRRAGVDVAFAHGAYGWMAALLAWQAGGDAEDPETLYEAVKRVRRLREAAAGAPWPVDDPFGAGMAALEIELSAVAALKAPLAGWTVSPLPRAVPGLPRRHAWSRSHVYVRARTEHPEAAFALASLVARDLADQMLAVTGEFPAYGGSCAPAGQAAVRVAAESAQRSEWCRGAPFRDRTLWSALRQALDAGWSRAEFAERLPEAVAAAPT